MRPNQALVAANRCFDIRATIVDTATALSSIKGAAPFADRLRALASTADLGELIAILRGLPLYPDQPGQVALATDGFISPFKP